MTVFTQTEELICSLSAEGKQGEQLRVGAHAKEEFRDLQIACRRHAYKYRIDNHEIIGWRWPYSKQ
jgi:hypothetical protein